MPETARLAPTLVWKHTGWMKALQTLALLIVLAGCKTTPVAGECADNPTTPCLAGRACTENRNRGCVECVCEAPHGSRPEGSPMKPEGNPE